jgi:hypothetical protein
MSNTHQQLARNAKPTITCHDTDQLFDMYRLQQELDHPDDRRSKPARTAMYWLRRLANHRANEMGLTREAVWPDIFDTRELQSDLQSSDERRRHLAHRVLRSVSTVVAIREVMESTDPTPIDLKVRAITISILAREAANGIARAVGEPELEYTLN